MGKLGEASLRAAFCLVGQAVQGYPLATMTGRVTIFRRHERYFDSIQLSSQCWFKFQESDPQVVYFRHIEACHKRVTTCVVMINSILCAQ